MRKGVFYLFFCVAALISSQLFSQEYKNNEELIWDLVSGETDIVFMDGNEYLTNKSFLINFDGYKNLYPEIEKVEEQFMLGGGSQDYDMTYRPFWLIRNDSIYLIGISLNLDSRKRNDSKIERDLQLPVERFLRMEKLVDKRFEKGDIPQACRKLIRPEYSIGIMFASWVDGVYYMKQTKEFSQSYSDWYKIPILKLTIKDGKIIKTEKV